MGQFLQSEQEAREQLVGVAAAASPSISVRWPRWGLGETRSSAAGWGEASQLPGGDPGHRQAAGAERGGGGQAGGSTGREPPERLIPAGVEVTVTRDYGVTAETKSNTLIGKLIFATTAVVLLVLVSMGWREAPGGGGRHRHHLARPSPRSAPGHGAHPQLVSLFALIFSIGILVDDAIVVVENIHRHRGLGKGRSRISFRARWT